MQGKDENNRRGLETATRLLGEYLEHGHEKEWLDKSDVMKYGTAILLMCMALYIAVGIPLARMIYGS